MAEENTCIQSVALVKSTIKLLTIYDNYNTAWWRGTVVERRSLAGELSLSCARPAADG